MGVLGLAFDAVIVSSALAGVRRATGWSALPIVRSWQNPVLVKAGEKYLQVGEYCIDKAGDLIQRGKSQDGGASPSNTSDSTSRTFDATSTEKKN